MKNNQWIQDIQRVIGFEVEIPKLLWVLTEIAAEDNSRGLFARKCQSKILECMENVKLFLGEIRRSAQDFTLHDITHCINVIDFMGQMLVDFNTLNPAEISFFIYSALLHDIGMVKLPDEKEELNDIRENHGDRSAKFIRERIISTDNGIRFNFGEWDDVYMEYLPLICASHMQEFSFVKRLPQSYILDGMEVDISLCAILLRVADSMDLKHNRAPYQLYQFLTNRSVSSEHWKKHMAISSCQVNDNGVYRVDGICSDESAHRCLYNHLDSIESEIEKVFKWMNGPHPKLSLKSHLVYRNINTQGYKMWNHSFSMDILKITNLFMGEQLYGDKKLGLREIIQNSIDACMVRDEMNKDLGTKQDYTYHPEISIIFDKENNQVIIRDNGTGMNNHIIENYFLNIGASYYSSRDFKKLNLEYSPSGYFGIGFLACFMLSDDVYVRTSHWQEDVEYEFHFIKSDKFVTKTEKRKSFSGTEIRLNLEQFIKVFTYSDSVSVLADGAEKEIIEFLDTTFWNLNISWIDKNVILCSVQSTSFLEFAQKRINLYFNYGYDINLSEYLIGIEGIIHLCDSELFYYIKSLAGINNINALNALKNGKVNISNDIRKSFLFINHFYTYNQGFTEISDGTDAYNSFIFFPTKDSKIELDGRLSEGLELEDSDVEEYFRSCSWNCLCLKKHQIFNDQILFRVNRDVQSFDNYEQFCDFLGYTPLCFIEAYGLNTKRLSNVIYIDNITAFFGHLEGYWLKQARIKLSDFVNEALSFIFFRVYNITMRITNSLIMPDSSRNHIISSSGDILKEAICLCVFLWIYDQIEADKKAMESKEYLRQLILKNWNDSVKGLLRPEKKPI